MSLREWLNGKKTYIAALGAFFVAIGAAAQAWAAGEPINYELIVSSLIALAVIFLRQGFKKEIEAATC